MAETNNKLQPVYYFVGEDALKRRAVEERLKNRIAETGDIDFNYTVLDGTKITAAEIIAACETMPFLAEYRYVLVKQAEGLNAAQGKALAAYIASPNETTVLALSTTGFDGRSTLAKLFAAAPKNCVVDCSIGNLHNLVRSLAVGHGITMTAPAIDALIELAGSDTVHLDAELEKLALAQVDGNPITPEQVRATVSPLAVTEFKPWEFLDAMCNREAAKCFHILSGVKDGDLIGLFSLVQGRLKELVAAKSSRLSSVSQLAAALGKKDWQVKNYHRWVSRFPEGHLERSIIKAVEADCSMKSGGDAREVFTLWLCEFFGV